MYSVGYQSCGSGEVEGEVVNSVTPRSPWHNENGRISLVVTCGGQA